MEYYVGGKRVEPISGNASPCRCLKTPQYIFLQRTYVLGSYLPFQKTIHYFSRDLVKTFWQTFTFYIPDGSFEITAYLFQTRVLWEALPKSMGAGEKVVLINLLILGSWWLGDERWMNWFTCNHATQQVVNKLFQTKQQYGLPNHKSGSYYPQENTSFMNDTVLTFWFRQG